MARAFASLDILPVKQSGSCAWLQKATGEAGDRAELQQPQSFGGGMVRPDPCSV